MKLHRTTTGDGGAGTFSKLCPEIKKDPESYQTEVELLYRNFKYSIDTHLTNFGANNNIEVGDNAFFLSQLLPFYPQLLSDLPHHLLHLLHRPTSLSPPLRCKLTRSLILLISKNVVAIDEEFHVMNTRISVLVLLMRLQIVNDRSLRKLAYSHVICCVKRRKSDHATSKRLRSVVVNMLESGDEALAKRSLVVLCDVYRMNVWRDELVSNSICRACYCQHPSLRKAALSFLISYHVIDGDDDSDSDGSNNEDDESSVRQSGVVLDREQVYKAYHKGTTASKKKKKAKLKRDIRSMKRQLRLSSQNAGPNHYSPLSDLHDPDAFVDELYSCLHRNDRRVQLSEVNMMTIIVIARTIGLHRLIKPKFYCFLGKYLMPHEKEITKLLAAAVEVFHADVPDDDVKPLFLQIVNNFIHNRSQPEALAVGLNVVREICLRMPRLMNDDLLQDLVLYNRESVRAVSTAAHSLLKLFKEVNPSLLAKKHRPRSGANARPKEYGEVNVATGVPGAHLLRLGEKNVDDDYDSIEVEKDGVVEDDDGSEDVKDDDGADSDEDADDDIGDDDDDDDDDDVIGLEDSALNECCAGVESQEDDEDSIAVGEEIRENDVEMEDEFSTLIESDDSHIEVSGERKRKYADLDQQLDVAEPDFRALKKLIAPKSEDFSKTDDHFYSNEEFQQIKKLLAKQCELQRSSGSKSATFKVPSSDQLNLKPVDPSKLEANIRTKMTKEQRMERMKSGREDRNEYKSRAAVKQNKKGGSSNRQKDHKKFMPIAAKRGKIARSKQEKKRKKVSSGKQFRGKKAWK